MCASTAGSGGGDVKGAKGGMRDCRCCYYTYVQWMRKGMCACESESENGGQGDLVN